MASREMNIKDSLRAELRSRRESLHPGQVLSLSEAVRRRVLALEGWKNASSVLAYVSVRGEVSTELLLRDAWSAGKQVLLPRCEPLHNVPEGAGLMECCCVTGPDQLVPGAYAIPEPDPDACPGIPDATPNIALIPALAFDRRGMRLGQGGGYYDRLLARPAFSETLLVGLAYDFQLLDRVPAEDWDVPVHCICTDKETLWL